MTGKDLIKELMKLRKVSQTTLGERIGKGQNSIAQFINQGKHEMRLDIFTEMVNALDCDVLVKSKNSDTYWVVSYEKPTKIKLPKK